MCQATIALFSDIKVSISQLNRAAQCLEWLRAVEKNIVDEINELAKTVENETK